MKQSGKHGLGQEETAKATSGQGDSRKIAKHYLDVAERTTATQQDEEPFTEEPNESSLMPLDTPTLESIKWAPQDKMRLLIVTGLFVLITVSMLMGNEATSQLIAVLSLVAGYFFGRMTITRT